MERVVEGTEYDDPESQTRASGFHFEDVRQDRASPFMCLHREGMGTKPAARPREAEHHDPAGLVPLDCVPDRPMPPGRSLLKPVVQDHPRPTIAWPQPIVRGRKRVDEAARHLDGGRIMARMHVQYFHCNPAGTTRTLSLVQ